MGWSAPESSVLRFVKHVDNGEAAVVFQGLGVS